MSTTPTHADWETVRSELTTAGRDLADLAGQLETLSGRLDAITVRDRASGSNSRSRAAVRGHLRRQLRCLTSLVDAGRCQVGELEAALS